MKITLKADEQREIVISDESFDVPGFVNISFRNEDSIDISLRELMPALIAFDAKNSREKEE